MSWGRRRLGVFLSRPLVREVVDSRIPWSMALEDLGRAIEALTPEQRRQLTGVEINVVEGPPRG